MFQQTTAQIKISKLRKRVRIIQGGTSSSKTFSIIPLLIYYAVENRGVEISIVSESIPHLKRGVIRDFIKIMQWVGNWKESNFNKTDLKYTFSNGSHIEFFSADQPDKLRGARRDVLFINEANNIDFESYQQLAIRTKNFIYLDYNPTHKFWVHSQLITDPDSDFIILTYKDNEALDSNLVAEIEKAKAKASESNYWANWWKVYGLGEIGILEGACIPEWEEIQFPIEARLLCYGMDFGYSNDFTTLIGLYKYNDAYLFDEVICQKGLLNSDISNLLKSNDIQDFIYADSSDPKSIAELSGYGHNIFPVKKGSDSIIHGLNLINQNKILISGRSKNLKNELQNYVWLKDKEGNSLNKPIDAFNHCIDAARYSLSSYVDSQNSGQYFIY